MCRMQIKEKLLLSLSRQGYQGCVTSARHVEDLKEEVEEQYEKGLFDMELWLEHLASFDSSTHNSLPRADSIIVVAAPKPRSQATFSRKGESRSLVIPPTYLAYEKTRGRVERLLARVLATKGYHVRSAHLPLKLLAARSGLGMYGRNNLCYVQGMGSLLQLVAVYTDMPCQKDNWQEARMMRNCENCCACYKACPTGAISPDRFQLHAGKCITFYNEKKGDIPFPEWVNPSWHNCLIGCFHCQRVCPQNGTFQQRVEETLEFSEKETDILLKWKPRDQLPKTTIKKLEKLDLVRDISIITRNLRVILKKQE